MKKKSRWLILLLIIIIYSMVEMGLINLPFGSSTRIDSFDYGNISQGSIQTKDSHITIEWKNGVVNRFGRGERLIVEIEEFNTDAPSLYIPIIKSYSPIVRANVKKENGRIVGSIIIRDNYTFTGLYGSKSIINELKATYSRQIIEYIDSRVGVGESSSEMKCQDAISFAPFRYLSDKKNLGTGILNPESTEYCIQPGLDQWKDTLFFSNRDPKNKGYTAYEVGSFDRKNDRIEIKRYSHNETLLLHASFESKSTWGDKYFKISRERDELGSTKDEGKLLSLKIYNGLGEVIEDHLYSNKTK